MSEDSNLVSIMQGKFATACPHGGGSTFIHPRGDQLNPREDWLWAIDFFDWLFEEHTSASLCMDCVMFLPSATNRKKMAAERNKNRQLLERQELDAKIQDALGSGEALFQCEGCDSAHLESELIQIRECPHESCGTEFFDGTINGRNCSECNRPFTKKVTDYGCPECEDNSEQTELEITDGYSD